MSKLRRGNYVFLLWKGDHGPRHLHIRRDGRFVAKWDLENGRVMTGRVNVRLRRLIEELRRERRL